MCQKERELEISLNDTSDYQSFIDSVPGPWQNCEGRTFSLGTPDSQCFFSSLFPAPSLCPFSYLGLFSSVIRTVDYLIFLLVCVILRSILYLQDDLPLSPKRIKDSHPLMVGESFFSCGVELGIEGAEARERSPEFTPCRWKHTYPAGSVREI